MEAGQENKTEYTYTSHDESTWCTLYSNHHGQCTTYYAQSNKLFLITNTTFLINRLKATDAVQGRLVSTQLNTITFGGNRWIRCLAISWLCHGYVKRTSLLLWACEFTSRMRQVINQPLHLYLLKIVPKCQAQNR